MIPARGRTKLLTRVLARLDEQRPAFEIVVVADRCPETVRAVRALSLVHPCRLYAIPEDGDPRFGAARARNVGARFARGELLVFLDADCLVGPDHVETYARAASAGEPDRLLIGPIDFVDADDWTRPTGLDPRPIFAPGAQRPSGHDPRVWLAGYCWTGNLGIGREAFRALGGFDLGFVGQGAEDVDFGLRCVARFGRVGRVDCRVRHVGPTSGLVDRHGDPSAFDDRRFREALTSGRYAGPPGSLAANGGEAYFRDDAHWRGFRDLRADAPRRAPPEAGPDASAPFQRQLERSAGVLVATARLLDARRPLEGDESEFLSLYGRVVATDPEVFSRVWSDPQASAWVRGASERLDAALREPTPETRRVLAERLEDFKRFALACAHLAGERLDLARPLRCDDGLLIPGTRLRVEGAAGAAVRGISADAIVVSGPGGRGERALSLDERALGRDDGEPAADAGPRVSLCPALDRPGGTIRFLPGAFRQAEGDVARWVVDAGDDYQRANAPALAAALERAVRHDPDTACLADWLQIVAFCPPGSTPFGNTSSSELPGACLLFGESDPLLLSETLVHELHHQRLFAVETADAFFDDEEQNAGTDCRHYSPWRPDPRPIKGVLHALYVYTAVARYHLAVLDAAPEADAALRGFARDRLAMLSLQLPAGLAIVRARARLSPAGRRLLDEIADGVEAVLAAVEAAGIVVAGSEAEAVVREHAERYDPGRVVARLRPTLRFARRVDAAPVAPDGAPRISALCVTRGRVAWLDRAVRCFLEQTWPHRELVILHEDDDLETVRRVERLARAHPDVVPVRVPRDPAGTLGDLRNRAVAAAGGELVCQWDDDDWHHPERMEAQWRALAGAPGKDASVLGRWTVFDAARRRAYLSPERLWEGSLLCRREALPAYPARSIGEDTPVVDALHRAGRLVAFERPDLYVYVGHGANTWTPEHFARFFDEALFLGETTSAEVAELLGKGAR